MSKITFLQTVNAHQKDKPTKQIKSITKYFKMRQKTLMKN